MDNQNTFFQKLKPNDDELSLRTIITFSILLLSILAIMIIMPYFVSGNLVGSQVNSSSLQIRQLAPEDLYVKRAFEYVDKKATQEKRETELKKINPIFSYDVSKTYQIMNRVISFSKGVKNNDILLLDDTLVNLSQSEKELFKNGYLKLTTDQKDVFSTWVLEIIKKIIMEGYYDQSEIQLLNSEGVNKITLKGYLTEQLTIEKLDTSKVLTINALVNYYNLELYIDKYLESNVNKYNISDNLFYLTIKGLLESNVHYDALLTSMEKDSVINSIEDVIVYVPAGEKILSKDTIISEKDLELLKQVEAHSAIFSNIQIIARVILILLITLFSIYWVWTRTQYTFRRVQFIYIYLILMVFSLFLSLIITYYCSKYNINVLAPCLPVLFGTVFLRNTTGKKRFGFLFTIQYALYSTLFPGSTFFSFFYLSAIGISFLYIIVYEGDRLSRIASIIYGCLIAMIMTVLLYAIQGYPFSTLFFSISVIIINILLCFLLERILLPFIDNLLNIPTIFRLDELKNQNQKLLSKLKFTAQGTFNHSINVSDLAYEAAKAIGADANLCKVAALYHDVGKTEHPEYFTENQDDGVNKHDELTPSMSGSIIRSHVKLGVDLCKDAGLPQEIINIISEHHGNDLIQYFYHEAIKDNENPFNKVVPSDYCYTGNPPRSKESAIVMIADSVEAASRSVKPSAQKVGRLISNIIRQKFDHGQLNDCHLDLTELKIIEKSLEQSLVGKLHTRIKYPNDEDKPNIKD